MTTSTEQLEQNCRSMVDEFGQHSETLTCETLDSALDIEFAIDRRGKFLGARLLVAFGGPNIWVDTRFDRVEGYWGGDQFQFNYSDVNDLHGACEGLYDRLR